MKGKKIIVSALAASLVATPIATLGATGRVAFADEATVEEKDYKVFGPELTIKRSDYPSNVQKGTEVTFKKLTTGTVKVLDPFGKEVTTTASGTDSLKFTPDVVGTYTYKFSVFGTNGEGHQDTVATTYELTLVVEGDSGSIEIPENSYFVIPSEFLTARKLTVPVPTCYVNDTLCDFGEANSFAIEGKNAVIKAVAKKGSDEVELNYVAGTSATVASEKAHFETATGSPLTEGVWSLRYQLEYNGDIVATTSSKTIKVKKSLTNTKLYAGYAKTPTRSAEAGVAYQLVDLNVSMAENSTNYVEAFTQITVKYIKNESESEEMVVDYDTMTFVPKYTGNYLVTYKAVIPSLGLESEELKYNIRNVTDSTQPTLYLTGGYYLDTETGRTYNKEFGYYDEDEDKYYVDDTKSTEVTGVVELTDLEMDEVYDEIENLSYNVKSYYQFGADGKVKVAIPAGYVRDNYSTANNIKVTRALYASTKTGEDDKLTLVALDDSENPSYNEVAYFTFDKDSCGIGNYIVRFVVQDEFNTETILDYAITIKETNSITNDVNNSSKKNLPVITFNYDEENVKADEKITFSAPTVSDSYDVNVNTRVFYTLDSTIGTSQKIDASSIAELISQGKLTFLKNADKNDDGKYEIDLNDIDTTSAGYIYVGVISDNSYNSGIYELNKNLVVKQIKLIGTNADVDVPVVEGTISWDLIKDGIKNEAGETATSKSMDEKGYVSGKAMFDQNDIVTIPSLKFVDADPDMRFDIRISYMSNGEQVVLSALEQGYSHDITKNDSAGTYTHTISDAKFRVSYAKLYTVTIVAIDSNENTTLISFGVRVNDTEAPVISVVNSGKFDDTVEVGKKFTIPSPTIIDDGEIDEEGDWSWSISYNGGEPEKRSKESTSFTPKETGTYVITYMGKDRNGNEAPNSEYRLNVTATALPEITLTQVMAAEEDIEWDANDDNQTVEIPMATAKDQYFAGSLKVSVTVKNANGDSVDVTESADSKTYTFPVKTQGKYTVTYSTQGRFKSNTKTFTLNVGDVEAPTLNWKDKETDLKQTMEVGDTWTFKFNMIEVEDEKELDFASKINEELKDGLTASALEAIEEYCTITMTKDSTNIDYKIVDNGLQYTFDDSGDYTFTIKLKDEAGNSSGTEYSYTITVNEPEQATTTKNSNAVGTVLIVLSVVILAGVVSYFVITTKKVDKKAIESKGKKDKKDNK